TRCARSRECAPPARGRPDRRRTGQGTAQRPAAEPTRDPNYRLHPLHGYAPLPDPRPTGRSVRSRPSHDPPLGEDAALAFGPFGLTPTLRQRGEVRVPGGGGDDGSSAAVQLGLGSLSSSEPGSPAGLVAGPPVLHSDVLAARVHTREVRDRRYTGTRPASLKFVL